jgi:hypothetical protein
MPISEKERQREILNGQSGRRERVPASNHFCQISRQVYGIDGILIAYIIDDFRGAGRTAYPANTSGLFDVAHGFPGFIAS